VNVEPKGIANNYKVKLEHKDNGNELRQRDKYYTNMKLMDIIGKIKMEYAKFNMISEVHQLEFTRLTRIAEEKSQVSLIEHMRQMNDSFIKERIQMEIQFQEKKTKSTNILRNACKLFENIKTLENNIIGNLWIRVEVEAIDDNIIILEEERKEGKKKFLKLYRVKSIKLLNLSNFERKKFVNMN
jgi:hypothetical protein